MMRGWWQSAPTGSVGEVLTGGLFEHALGGAGIENVCF